MNVEYQCELCDFKDADQEIVVNHLETHHRNNNPQKHQETESFWNDAYAINMCDDYKNHDPSADNRTTWTDDMTKLLISLYGVKKPLAEGQIKTLKIMWKQVSDEMHSYGYNLTIIQIENKWKSLERMYKNTQQNKKLLEGEGKYVHMKVCRELAEILNIRHSINPIYTLESSTTTNTAAATAIAEDCETIDLESDIEANSDRSTPVRKKQKVSKSMSLMEELQNLRVVIEKQNQKREKYQEVCYQQKQEIIQQLKIKNALLEKLVEK